MDIKTKRAMKPYTCHLCKGTVEKGEQYARKNILVGWSTIWAHGGVVPDWAWESSRLAYPICVTCSESPEQLAKAELAMPRPRNYNIDLKEEVI